MTVKIISPEQRRAEPRGARIVVTGPFGVGKTSLVRTLDPATTLVIDVDNGTLAIDDVPVPHVRPETWPEIRDLIVRIAGPNRSFQPHEPYSQAHFDMCGGYLPGVESGQIRTIFLDTVSMATRLCHRWASAQPEAFSERSGKPDTRGTRERTGAESLTWSSRPISAHSFARSCHRGRTISLRPPRRATPLTTNPEEIQRSQHQTAPQTKQPDHEP